MTQCSTAHPRPVSSHALTVSAIQIRRSTPLGVRPPALQLLRAFWRCSYRKWGAAWGTLILSFITWRRALLIVSMTSRVGVTLFLAQSIRPIAQREPSVFRPEQAMTKRVAWVPSMLTICFSQILRSRQAQRRSRFNPAVPQPQRLLFHPSMGSQGRFPSRVPFRATCRVLRAPCPTQQSPPRVPLR